MSSFALVALQAMLSAQNATLAAHDAERENLEKTETTKKAAKAAKKESVASGTEDSASSGITPIRGAQGADASGFSVWRGKRATGPGYVAGAAGPDHESRKMRDSLIALARTAVAESDEHAELANICDRNRDLCSRDGNVDDAVGFAQDGILERGMAQVKLALAEAILSEVESNDVAALACRYRQAGNALQVIEETVSASVGSFTGEEYTLPRTETDERRARCRVALAREAEKNSVPDATPESAPDATPESAPVAIVADREAELARLLAEQSADDGTQIDSYLE